MTNVELFNDSSKPLMYINAKTVPKPPFLSVNLDNIYHIIDSTIILCIVIGQNYCAKFIVFFKEIVPVYVDQYKNLGRNRHFL